MTLHLKINKMKCRKQTTFLQRAIDLNELF